MNNDLSIPRSIKTKNTKEKIYQAAVTIMKKNGYEYLSVKNICQVAGISNGTFFYHYKTKEDLMSYYIHEGFDRYRNERNFDVSNLAFDAQITEYYKCYSSYVEENGLEFISNYYIPQNKVLNTRGHRYDGVDNNNSWVVNLTCRCLQQAERDGLLKDNHTAIGYANNCCTMLKGIIFDWALTDGAVDMKDLITELIGGYLNSIKK